MAAGQDLEPYWEVYRQHFRSHVLNWMEKYRVGSLSKEEAIEARNFDFGDMFVTDPVRDPNLLGCTQKPWNGEPRIDLLTEKYITPNELFYVRNHLAVPDIGAFFFVFCIPFRSFLGFFCLDLSAVLAGCFSYPGTITS